MKHTIAVVGAVLWVMLIFWAFGFDFSERGFFTEYLVICCTIAASFAATWPFND